jgi:hypothetical protein
MSRPNKRKAESISQESAQNKLSILRNNVKSCFANSSTRSKSLSASKLHIDSVLSALKQLLPGEFALLLPDLTGLEITIISFDRFDHILEQVDLYEQNILATAKEIVLQYFKKIKCTPEKVLSDWTTVIKQHLHETTELGYHYESNDIAKTPCKIVYDDYQLVKPTPDRILAEFVLSKSVGLSDIPYAYWMDN